MKKDKIFEILNGEKPRKSVLDAAYAEMDASRAEKKPDRRNKLALKWAAGVLVPVIAVSVFIAIINPFGGAKSSAPMNDEALDMSNEAEKGGTEVPFSFDYNLVADAYAAAHYVTDRGENITIYIFEASPTTLIRPSDAEDITVDALGVSGYRFFDGELHNVVFQYGETHYVIRIHANEARIDEILSDIRLN